MPTKLNLKDVESVAMKSMTRNERIEFCKLWPNAKDFLELLKEKIKNPIIKAIIQLVIAIADGLFKKNCPVPKTK